MDVLLDPVALLGLVGVGIGVIIPIILIAGRNRARMPEGPRRPTISSDMPIAIQGQDMGNGAPQPPPGWYESENGRAYWDGESWHLAQEPLGELTDDSSLPGEQNNGLLGKEAAQDGSRRDAFAFIADDESNPLDEAVQSEPGQASDSDFFMGLAMIGVAIYLFLGFFGIFGVSIFGWSVGDLFSDDREIACIESGGNWNSDMELCLRGGGMRSDPAEVACIESGGSWRPMGRTCWRPPRVPSMGER